MDIWASYHIHFNGSLDSLLSESVRPIVDEITTNKIASQFFFIRYWEDGPHIRLRLKGRPYLVNERARKVIEARCRSYLQKTNDKGHLNVASSALGQLKLKVKNVLYEPETARYGGLKALEICEKHFEHSSVRVLEAISRGEKWGYSDALITAIKMHLVFAGCAGLSDFDAYLFFSRQFQSWFPNAFYTGNRVKKQDRDEHLKDVLMAFDSSYTNQKAVLLTLVDKFFSCRSGQELRNLPDSSILEWASQVEWMCNELNNLDSRGSLEIPAAFKEIRYQQQPIKRSWFIYDSLCHMTNNRLGLTNQDEGFIFFMLSKVFRELSASVL